MHISSPEITVNQSAKTIYNKVSNLKNFEQLMPENISKFEMLSDTKFVFALKGMPEITLEIKEQLPPNKIVLGAAEGKLDFTLTGHITEVDIQKSNVMLEFDSKVNPMLAMMIKKPITSFLETLAKNMPKLS